MSNNFKINDGKAIGSMFLVVAFFWLISYMFPVVVDDAVVVAATANYDDWIEEYQVAATSLAAIVFLSAIGWYGIARWYFQVEYPIAIDRRHWWLACFALPIFSYVLILFLWDSQIKEGQSSIYVSLGMLAVMGFYFATVFFSPPAYKYTPWGSEFFRGSKKLKMAVTR